MNRTVFGICYLLRFQSISSKLFLIYLGMFLQWTQHCSAINLFADRPSLNQHKHYSHNPLDIGSLSRKSMLSWSIDASQVADGQSAIDRNAVDTADRSSLDWTKQVLSEKTKQHTEKKKEESLLSSSEPTSTDSDQSSTIEVMSPRERRLWNGWLAWLRPSDRFTIGFMPVRGRKATFIPTRGKKNALSTVVDESPPHIPPISLIAHPKSTSTRTQVYYYLVALTVKPLSFATDALD